MIPALRDSQFIPRLAPRRLEAHKGDFGRALLIGGSRGMAGAIALAGMAALRGGAGLVRLAVPACCLDTVAGFEPSYMTVPLPNDEEGRLGYDALEPIEELIPQATSVACGPGLGRSEDLTNLLTLIYRNTPRPLVVDADGLNALASSADSCAWHAGPRIVTPHPGEFRRLLGHESALEHAADALALDAVATDWARKRDLIMVLKGHRTLVTDGQRTYRNETGNPGMATGGSGDVLTGLITALLCQGMPPWEAAVLGVFLHGLAGDLAARELGQVSLIASDLVRFLPAAFREFELSWNAAPATPVAPAPAPPPSPPADVP